MASRFERARLRLSGLDTKNTLIRRFAARCLIFILLCVGVSGGTLIIIVVGTFAIGGTKALSDLWMQEGVGHEYFLFDIFAIIVGGFIGGYCGVKLGKYFVARFQLLSDEAVERL